MRVIIEVRVDKHNHSYTKHTHQTHTIHPSKHHHHPRMYLSEQTHGAQVRMQG